MKLATLVVSIFLFLVFCPHPATTHAQQKPEDLAQKAADSWLALTDAGKFAESWDKSSQFFKTKVTKDQWVDALKQVRTPLGAVQSRKLNSAKYDKNPPGAPEAEFVILKYDTNFEQFPAAVETISFMLDKDGKWRAAGYYIKQASQ
jgi:Protein of unknown function (DUF4019)